MTEVDEGRHRVPNQRRYRLKIDAHQTNLRFNLLLISVVVGLALAFLRWTFATPLLGANLPVAAHVVLVAALLLAAALAVVVAARSAYRQLATWSQARRARQRGSN